MTVYAEWWWRGVPKEKDRKNMSDYISREKAIDTADDMRKRCDTESIDDYHDLMVESLSVLPSADVQPVVRCKDCKHWRRQTNYAGAQLSFGFCESDDMWRSLYGETYEVEHIDTDDDFYCGYAERREDG